MAMKRMGLVAYNVAWARPTSLPSGILIHPSSSPQETWAENQGRLLCPFWGDRRVTI